MAAIAGNIAQSLQPVQNINSVLLKDAVGGNLDRLGQFAIVRFRYLRRHGQGLLRDLEDPVVYLAAEILFDALPDRLKTDHVIANNQNVLALAANGIRDYWGLIANDVWGAQITSVLSWTKISTLTIIRKCYVGRQRRN